MGLRNRKYLEEGIRGIPFSEFKVGKKVVMQKRPIYSHNAPHTADKEIIRTISKVEEFEGDSGNEPFLMVYFKETKGRGFRSGGKNRTVGELSSYASRRPLKYNVIEVR